MINTALNETVRSLRIKNLKKKRQAKTQFWSEKDLLDGEIVDAGVVIMPTKGCSWGRASGCTMCGYVYDSGDLTDSELLTSFRNALDSFDSVEYLKIFNSGSFLDRKEVSKELSDSIASEINKRDFKQVQVESRPEFVKEKVLEKLKESLEPNLEVGIGLESSNDRVRELCINKGFTFEDYRKAVALCRSNDVRVKTYLLLKPPFILEREAISDMVESGKAAALAGSDKISINPMNIQRGTLVELLWRRGEYRPPWIWSLINVLKELFDSDLNIPILSHPTSGGRKRGTHNCGVCDTEAIESVYNFSKTQEPKFLDSFDCDCKKHWEDFIYLE